MRNYRTENNVVISYSFIFFLNEPVIGDVTTNSIDLNYYKSNNYEDSFSMSLSSRYSNADKFTYRGKNFVGKENITAQYIKAVDSEQTAPNWVFKSKAEIEEYFEMYQEEHLLRETALKEELEKYNETYFEDKYLALASVETEEGQEMEILSYQFEQIKEKTLIVKLKYEDVSVEKKNQRTYMMLEIDKKIVSAPSNETIALYTAT